MTKSKQKDNPKFSFLFGGEYFNYYKWKVSSEVGKLFLGFLLGSYSNYYNKKFLKCIII